MTYCISVWGTSSNVILDAIENLHSRAARLIHKIKDRTLTNEEVMHKIFYDNCPPLLSRPFEKQESRTQNKSQLDLKQFKREIGRNSLRYRGSLLWNAIDKSLKEKDNTQEFKNNIKLHIDFINKFSFKSDTCILQPRLKDYHY